MNAPNIKWEIRIGEALQFLVLVGGILLSYGALYNKLAAVGQIQKQTTRIERYLSTKDQNYWPTVKQLDGDDE